MHCIMSLNALHFLWKESSNNYESFNTFPIKGGGAKKVNHKKKWRGGGGGKKV